jgi:hypothetical protein
MVSGVRQSIDRHLTANSKRSLWIDDDGNGVLDTAEVESLFRFIYQTETISPKITAMLEAADADHDKLISKGGSTIRGKGEALQPIADS